MVFQWFNMDTYHIVKGDIMWVLVSENEIFYLADLLLKYQ